MRLVTTPEALWALAAALVAATVASACGGDDAKQAAVPATTSTTAPAPAPAPTRTVVVSQGEAYNPAGCSTCERIVVTLSGFTGAHNAQLYCSTDCGESQKDWGPGLSGVVSVKEGRNETPYAYGYESGCVWAVVDGVMSNRVCNWYGQAASRGRTHERESMISAEQASWFSQTFNTIVGNIEHAIVGKRSVIQLAVACLVSEGHLLLEDAPGTGKTSLAKALSNSVQGTATRIQFTPDLLPTDVVGVTIYNQQTGAFDFHRGPIFATIVLADEINRASPKTQSALLEVMEEGNVTVDGISHSVGAPFMVLATQNPIEQAGTYRLPEAQLDRFLMRTSLGYPDHNATVQLLAEASTKNRAATVGAVVSPDAVREMSRLAGEVHVEEPVLAYVSRIIEETRRADGVLLGVSVRGALALVRVAKSWAAAAGRTFVSPDDVKAMAPYVLGHRLILTPDAEFSGVKPEQVLARVLGEVPPPKNRAA